MARAFLLLILSFIGCAASVLVPEVWFTAFVFAPMVLVSLLMLWQARGSAAQLVIIDGSNVMYWRNETPGWSAIEDVVAQVQRDGLKAGVMFDANAGYVLSGRYLHDEAFAKQLGLPVDQIMVVPKGTQADGYILQAARDHKARIVTNDKFRDWADRFPEVETPDVMISGRYRDGHLVLDV